MTDARAALEAALAEAEIVRLREALRDASLQIEYLHEKFQETGSGNAVLAKLRTFLGDTHDPD